MIENWYLADTEQISATKAFLKNRLAQKDYEGRDGKKALARMMKTGYTYNEVVHGPQLFVAIRLTVARKNSSSLDHFLATLSL